MLAAIDQQEVMAASMGGDPQNMITGVRFLRTGKKDVDESGMELARTGLLKGPAPVFCNVQKA
jgi:hypothetical protein